MKLLRFAVIVVPTAPSIVAFAQLLGWNAALGQGPSFEAASVKASAPMAGGRIRIGFSGGPGTSDPGRIELFGITLKTALTRAYGVKDHQADRGLGHHGGEGCAEIEGGYGRRYRNALRPRRDGAPVEGKPDADTGGQ